MPTESGRDKTGAPRSAGQPHIKSLSHQYLISEAIVQCRPDTLLPDADLRRLTLQKIDRHMPNHSHIVRCITPTNPTPAFAGAGLSSSRNVTSNLQCSSFSIPQCERTARPNDSIATRYEKLSRTFMTFIHIASTWIMLR